METKDTITVRRVKKKKKKGEAFITKGGGLRTGGGSLTPSPISSGGSLIFFFFTLVLQTSATRPSTLIIPLLNILTQPTVSPKDVPPLLITAVEPQRRREGRSGRRDGGWR